MKQQIKTKSAPKPIGPYSQAIIYKDLCFLSGQIGINYQTNELKTSSIEEETEMIMKNISNILLENDLTTDNIIKTTIYMIDLTKFERVNSVYAKFFKKTYPARETVQVSALPMNVNIEISVIAGLK
jgi:2-iminobutanoate/2-iminopropanoate deaminase|tara:strand:- start:148 stop:528 length:381 start_codon:yes stop_codon:yes gene_type:complete